MQLYIIRHGQSVNNALWSTTGSNENRVEDPELTEMGKRQAELVADYLACTPSSEIRLPYGVPYGTNFGGFSLTNLYCSLMLRAVQTGIIISERTGVPLVAWIDLHECGGIYLEEKDTGAKLKRPGKSRTYFESNFPNLILPASLDHRGWWNRPFEEERERVQRALRVVDRLMQDHGSTDHRVGIITHGEFYSRILCCLLKIPKDNRMWFTLNNAGITRVDIDPVSLNVVYLNRIEFLPAELVT